MNQINLHNHICQLTHRANQAGIQHQTISSLQLIEEPQRLVSFAADHKQIVESVYGPGGHGILACQTPIEIAAEMQKMQLITWNTYDKTSGKPIASSSFQLTGNRLFWDVVRCARDPKFPTFPGSLTIVTALKELLEYQNLAEITLGISAEVRTGTDVKRDDFTIPGGPQMLLIAMQPLQMSAFGFEPLIATAWGIKGRNPLTEFFQISYRFWNSDAAMWQEPIFLDENNPLLTKLAQGIWFGNYNMPARIHGGSENYDQSQTVIQVFGNQFATVTISGETDTQTVKRITAHLFERENSVRFIRFVVINKPQNVGIQTVLRKIGAIPTIVRPHLQSTVIDGQKTEIDMPAEICFGILKPGTGETLIPFGLSKLHNNPEYLFLKQYAMEAYTAFSQM